MGRLKSSSLTAVAVLLLSMAYPAWGAEGVAPTPAPLSLEECISVALGGHPKIKGAESDVKAAQWRTREAGAAFWPQVDFQSSRTGAHSERIVRLGASSVKTLSNVVSNSYALNTNWTLFDFGRTYYNVKSLAKTEVSSLHDLSAAEQLVAYDVMDAYYNLLKAQSLVKVTEETLSDANDHLKQSQAFFEAGVKPRFDVTSAEVEVNNATVQVIKSKDDVKAARATLNTKIGLDPLAPTAVQERPALEDLGKPMTDYLQEAIKNRQDILSLEEKLASSEMSVKAAYADYLPSLSGSISQSWYKEHSVDTLPSKSWQVALDIPIFSGFQTTSRVGETRANALSLKYKIDDLKLTVQQQVSTAYLNVEDAKERLGALESSVKKARENLDIAKGRYEAGVGAFIEVTDAQVSLTTAETNLTQAIYDYHLAWSSLMRGVGKQVR